MPGSNFGSQRRPSSSSSSAADASGGTSYSQINLRRSPEPCWPVMIKRSSAPPPTGRRADDSGYIDSSVLGASLHSSATSRTGDGSRSSSCRPGDDLLHGDRSHPRAASAEGDTQRMRRSISRQDDGPPWLDAGRLRQPSRLVAPAESAECAESAEGGRAVCQGGGPRPLHELGISGAMGGPWRLQLEFGRLPPWNEGACFDKFGKCRPPFGSASALLAHRP
mmetsp:Transcript_135175/g.432044  ORF Transcript_135175/g.432044 Transcript_135175/m.432044 type:complete len:222 (+) Transcript_135175:731-1396(+)